MKDSSLKKSELVENKLYMDISAYVYGMYMIVLLFSEITDPPSLSGLPNY